MRMMQFVKHVLMEITYLEQRKKINPKVNKKILHPLELKF